MREPLLSPFRVGFVIATLLASVSVAVISACGDSGASSDLESDGGNTNALPQDARLNDLDGGPPVSTMRLAHLAPDVGPIDFCYQAARTGTFVGPVLSGGGPNTLENDASTDADADPDADADADLNVDASDAASDTDANANANDDGGDGGAPAEGTYRFVSKYLNLEASGPITIAIVAAGSASCGGAIATGTVTLDPGKLSTVVITGTSNTSDAGTPIEITAFTDDRSTETDEIRVRVIHAALGKSGSGSISGAGPLGVRVTGSITTVLTDRVEPRKASTPSQSVPVDSLGYTTAAPLPPQTSIAIGAASTDGGADAGFEPWQSKAFDLDLRGGSLHTAFVLTGASASTFEVVWCDDTTTTGDQTNCTLVR